ncbi:MAG: threonylcarbamoyl-AMP synthase [Pyrinomonadaceae bacterium]|nr:threonylcarbamoyl-AMP synthase [Pyrinomonadaceae bacterium]
MIVQDTEHGRARAAEEIAKGNVVAFRTDTFYGLGANPFNQDAVRRLVSLKSRERKPVLIVISEVAQVERLFERRTKLFEDLSARFWPGALTIIERAQMNLTHDLTAGTKTIGVRLPDDEDVRDFLRSCGGALTATSANAPGAPPARTAAEAAEYFPSLLILDGVAARGEQPSSVLDISRAPRVSIIREGAVKFDELQKALRGMNAELEMNAGVRVEA